MADYDELVIATTTKLKEMAQHADRLAIGLQNVAPADQGGKPNSTIQYLQDVAKTLNESAKECIKLGPAHFHESTTTTEEK